MSNPVDKLPVTRSVAQPARIYSIAKRALDLVVGGLALIVTSPLLGFTALAVRVTMGRPVLFGQQRPGRGGRLFTIHKFRTMTAARDAHGQLLRDEQRLTRTGHLIRSFSLDELPQLWNVLRGDLSLVGPRPLLVEYLSLYTPEQARRHEVPPGITGWAQVKGRNALSWEEKFALDTWYVDHRGLWLDVWILVLTVGQVFQRKGIAQPGRATMDEFRGSPERGASAGESRGG